MDHEEVGQLVSRLDFLLILPKNQTDLICLTDSYHTCMNEDASIRIVCMYFGHLCVSFGRVLALHFINLCFFILFTDDSFAAASLLGNLVYF
jgi:hypothetical protein